MRVAIAGAGAVGRSIARELIQNGHQVLLIDKNPDSIKPERVPDAEWLLADSCELSSLEEARLDRCDVVIAATGDDKVNLVTSLLAKTEFGVPRTVGRVNHPNNEWLFTEAWGVDVNVSTPRIMSALVEEAVTVGDLVRLFTFRQGNANLVEMTLPADSPYVGKPAGLIPFPENCALVTILRDGQVYVPDAEQPVEAGDELLFVVPADVEDELERLLAPAGPRRLAGRRGRSTGVWLRASTHTIAASAASCSGQPIAILRMPSAATAESASIAPDLRGEPDRRLHDHPQQARAAPAARSASCTAARPGWSRCHAVGVAGDAADHEADQRPADQAGERQHDGVAGVVDDAGQEVGQRLVVRAAAAARRDRDEEPADADAEERVEAELHRRALHQPGDQQHDRRRRC